jgi:hypothetical protein
MILAIWMASVASGQSTTPPRQDTTITVSNSPGATTTTNFIYQEARRDRKTQQLVAALRNSSATFSVGSQLWQVFPTYLYALNDPQDGASDTGATFSIVVAGALDLDGLDLGTKADRCNIGAKLDAIGFLGEAVTEGSVARTHLRVMTRDDGPLLRQICEGLRSSSGRATANETVYAHLSQGTGVVIIGLFPERLVGSDLEADMIGNFWTGALLSRYVRTPAPDPKAMLALLNQMDGAFEGSAFDLPLQLPFTYRNPSSYPTEARHEFGARIDRLESDWKSYLAEAAMTLRSERRAVVTKAGWARLVPRFTRSQIGSRDFWLAANDLSLFYDQLGCLGKDFLVDRGYVSPDDITTPNTCALNEIRLPSNQGLSATPSR